MAETLSIEWRSEGVRGVVARTEQGIAKVVTAFDEAWPQDARPTESVSAASAWLRDRIATAKFTGREVTVLVPRASSVVRRLDLPPVPDAELADMVAMQAATRSSSGLDGLALDYTPLPPGDGDTGRRVLAATCARDLLERITNVCDGAGLKVTSVGIGSIAAADLVVRATSRSRDTSALVLGVHDRTLESVLLRGQSVVFTQSTELHSETTAQLGKAVASDVRRLLLAHGNGLTAGDLDHVWWLGDPDRTDAERTVVSSALNVEIEPFDPLANDRVRTSGQLPELDTAVLAAAVGGALPTDGHVPRFDFLSPRKPPKRVDHAKRRKVAIIAAVAVGLIALVGWRQWTIATLDAEIASLRTNVRDLERVIETGEPIRERAGRIRAWESLDRDWLEEVTNFVDELPGRDRVLLDELRLHADPRSPIGRIEGNGLARSRDELQDAQARLDAQGYVVPAWKIDGRSFGDGYDREFSFDVRLPENATGSDDADAIAEEPNE